LKIEKLALQNLKIKEKPLLGQKVLVTRPRETAQALSDRLRVLGASPIEIPTISIEPLYDYSKLDHCLDNLNAYDWIIFTSANGVKYFFRRLQNAEFGMSQIAPSAMRNADDWQSIQIAAIGPATASALKGKGFKADFIPKKYLASEIGKEIGNIKGKRILLPRADIASKELTETLRKKGAVVDDVDVYRTIPNAEFGMRISELRELIEKGEIDWITFTSASAVNSFATILSNLKMWNSEFRSPNSPLPKVACIGPVTAKACQKAEIPVQVIAKEHTIQGLVNEMVEWLKG
jgi:uroporphyrinogen III methyltransferase/synthase